MLAIQGLAPSRESLQRAEALALQALRIDDRLPEALLGAGACAPVPVGLGGSRSVQSTRHRATAELCRRSCQLGAREEPPRRSRGGYPRRRARSRARAARADIRPAHDAGVVFRRSSRASHRSGRSHDRHGSRLHADLPVAGDSAMAGGAPRGGGRNDGQEASVWPMATWSACTLRSLPSWAGPTRRARPRATWKHDGGRAASWGPDLVAAWAGVGDTARALDWLEAACRQKDASLIALGAPWFDCLRAEPRFQAVLREVGLPLAPSGSLTARSGSSPAA